MKIVAGLFLFSLIVAPVRAQSSDDSIRELIRMTGSDTMATQMIDLIMPQLQEMMPDVPDEFWKEFRGQLDPGGVVELVVPIYRNHYTDQEILQLIEFYKTPLGQKVIQETPKILQESYRVGEEWGQQVAIKAVQMLTERGYMLPEEK